MIIGYVDRFDLENCSGWVFDTEDLSRQLTINLVCNGIPVFSEEADLPRVDVEEARGVLLCGFSFAVAEYLPMGKSQVEIRIVGSDYQFPNMPVTMDPRLASDFVEHGRDGWLFLQNDANDVPAIVAGRKPLATEDIEHICIALAKREQFFSKMENTKFISYVVPEKSVILSHLRHESILSPNRPAMQLIDGANAIGLTSIFYRPDVFAKNCETLFSKGDTHFNGFGMRRLFDDIMALLDIKQSAPSRIELGPAILNDLGDKIEGYEAEPSYRLIVDYPGIVTEDTITPALRNLTKLRGTKAHYEKGDGKRLLLYGTSTAHHVRELFFGISSEMRLNWATSIDFEEIEAFKPDIVINLITERTIGRHIAD